MRFHGRIGAFKRAVFLSLFSAVIKDTPVLTGRLRANWQFGKDSIPDGTVDSVTDPTPGVATQVAANVDDKDGKVYLANGLPYVNRIEYEGHSAHKAPEGMVRKNLTRVAGLIRANLPK